MWENPKPNEFCVWFQLGGLIMECYKFVCKGCESPLEFPCEECLCYKECICCIHYDYEYGYDCEYEYEYCRAYGFDIIHIND